MAPCRWLPPQCVRTTGYGVPLRRNNNYSSCVTIVGTSYSARYRYQDEVLRPYTSYRSELAVPAKTASRGKMYLCGVNSALFEEKELTTRIKHMYKPFAPQKNLIYLCPLPPSFIPSWGGQVSLQRWLLSLNPGFVKSERLPSYKPGGG